MQKIIWLINFNHYILSLFGNLFFMGEILTFGLKNKIDSELNYLKEWITKTPAQIQIILDTPCDEIVILEDKNRLRDLIFEYIVQKLDKDNISFKPDITQAMQYISDLVFKIWINDDKIKDIINNPYFNYWMEKNEPKKAWDASVYNFVTKPDWSKYLKRENYLNFATSWYYQYFWKEFAWWINQVLPYMEEFSKEKLFINDKIYLIKN